MGKKRPIESTASASTTKSSAAASAKSPSPIKRAKKDNKATPVVNAKLEPAKQLALKSKAAASVNTILDWPFADIHTLIESILKVLPKNDHAKYNTAVEKLAWEKIKFDGHSADECKEKWLKVQAKQRRFRTLTEMAHDAKNWTRTPWASFNGSSQKTRHPDLPKKPLTPFFLYFTEKREAFGKKNTQLTVTEISKELSKKYQELDDKKKNKYKKQYAKEYEVYKQNMDKFKCDHPELMLEKVLKDRTKQGEGPRKPRNPFHIFQEDKIKRVLEGGVASSKEVMDEIKTQWGELSEGKKVKWIRRALDDECRYTSELVEYKKDHPLFEPPVIKSVVTKAEQNLKDKYDGKPERPPNSGYSLFSKQMLTKIQNVDAKEKMSEIARRWKELAEETRLEYNLQAQDKIAKYTPKFDAYLLKLTPEERAKMEKVKVKVPSVKTEEKQKKQFEAVKVADLIARPDVLEKAKTLYLGERTDVLISTGSKFSDGFKQANDDWTKLTVAEMEKYLREAQKEMNITVAQVKKSPRKDKVELPTNIKKEMPALPPKSGYALFNQEKLRQLTHIDSKKRMTEIARLWNDEMNAKQKSDLDHRLKVLTEKYLKEVEKYKRTLSSADRLVFDSWLASRLPSKSRVKKVTSNAVVDKKGGGAAKVAKGGKQVPVTPVEESSEEDEEEEDEDEDQSPKVAPASSEEEDEDSDEEESE